MGFEGLPGPETETAANRGSAACMGAKGLSEYSRTGDQTVRGSRPSPKHSAQRGRWAEEPGSFGSAIHAGRRTKDLTVPDSTFRLLSRLVFSTCILSLSLLAIGATATADEELNLGHFFGFSGVELYKLDDRAFGLCHGDFDGDGRSDLVAVDNRASCLRLFRQLAERPEAADERRQYVNELNSDWRFEIDQISVDKQVAGLVSGDFDSDGRIDLAYVGAPDRLVIRYQPPAGKSEWTRRWSVRLPDLAPAAWMLAAGDLNHDGKADIAVLGKNETYLLYQKPEPDSDGSMQSPETLINTSAQLALLQIADLDGDGMDDLSYQANEGSNRGLCARLQTDSGKLGPEVRFDLQQPRSVTLANVDDKPGHEVLTVDSRSGRVTISAVRRKESDDGELQAQLVQYGIGPASSREKRAVALGDVDGDGRTDVVVTDPGNAQVLVYRQAQQNGLGVAEAFPGLLGAIEVAISNMDGDGRNEVILMSDKESAVAVSQFTEGRLQFPQVVSRPLDGYEFVAMTVTSGKDRPELVVFHQKGSGSSADVRLQRLHVTSDGTWQPVGEPESLEGSVVGTRGLSVLSMDADSDGAQDLLLVPNGTSKGLVLLPTSTGEKQNERWNVDPLNVGASSAGELFLKDGLLYVAREAFARVMKFTDNEWSIADQFNAGESRARIAGVAVLNLDETDDDEVVLVDTGVKKLRALRKSNGLYRPWKEVDLGTTKFVSSHVADLNGDQKEDLLLFGNEQFSVLYSGDTGVSLNELATFESDRDDAYAADILAGDLNSDGRVDLTLIDTSIDGLEILNFDRDDGLQAATHFRVFEEKRLVTESGARGTEPREGMIADVTGDGRNDLILICHDRLIVYPQDTGEQESNAAP